MDGFCADGISDPVGEPPQVEKRMSRAGAGEGLCKRSGRLPILAHQRAQSSN